MKLKTLKDIHMEEYMRLIIKQEAIKWVKKHNDKKMDCCWNQPVSKCWGMGKDFIEFFNITDEDLK